MTDQKQHRALDIIADEYERQVACYGKEYHVDGLGLTLDNENYATEENCDYLRKTGEGSWKNLLLAELQEALKQSDEQSLQNHLARSAALTAAWIECLERRMHIGQDTKPQTT